ncbi:hypothetical protein PG985_015846 [Apiospora marii]|uniref:Uncharacterized protein n=1 Tax=Apiospora marii TaxID=335849 RepID=A0ABR1S5M4_9PEZI
MIEDLQLRKQANIQHVIVSGGLGGSPYIQETLRSQYGKDTALEKAEFHSLDLPQLCVCKGLVIDRIEKMKLGKSSFSKLCARVSLGVLKREKYNSMKASHRRAKKEERTEIKNKQEVVPFVEWCINRTHIQGVAYVLRSNRRRLHGQMTIVES